MLLPWSFRPLSVDWEGGIPGRQGGIFFSCKVIIISETLLIRIWPDVMRKATEKLSYANTNCLKDSFQSKLIQPWISSAFSIQEFHSKVILVKHKFHPSNKSSDWVQVVGTWIFRLKAKGLSIFHFSLKTGCPFYWISRNISDSKRKVGPMSNTQGETLNFSCPLVLLYSSPFEIEIALKKGSLMKLGLLTFTAHTPSAFELNLAQVIVQIFYATSQNSNSWKEKMNKHLFCNSCTVGGWFKAPYNTFF